MLNRDDFIAFSWRVLRSYEIAYDKDKTCMSTQNYLDYYTNVYFIYALKGKFEYYIKDKDGAEMRKIARATVYSIINYLKYRDSGKATFKPKDITKLIRKAVSESRKAGWSMEGAKVTLTPDNEVNIFNRFSFEYWLPLSKMSFDDAVVTGIVACVMTPIMECDEADLKLIDEITCYYLTFVDSYNKDIKFLYNHFDEEVWKEY